MRQTPFVRNLAGRPVRVKPLRRGQGRRLVMPVDVEHQPYVCRLAEPVRAVTIRGLQARKDNEQVCACPQINACRTSSRHNARDVLERMNIPIQYTTA